jgi:hypothetical protein
MAEPMDRTLFDALLTQSGLPLTEAERAGIHDATRHLMPMLARLHAPRPVALEPATVFVPK